MDFQKIIGQVNSAREFDEIKLNEVKKCLDHEDWLIRSETVASLSKFVSVKEIETILIEKLKDKNYIVRCDACDALYQSKNIDVLHKLFECVKKDRSSTVRMYAISTLGNLLKEIHYLTEFVTQIKDAYSKEKSKRVIISYMVVLYILDGEKQYIIDVLKHLSDKDYHIRCNVINMLGQVFNEQGIKDIIKNAFYKQYVIETTRAVKSTIEEFYDFSKFESVE